MARLDVKGPNLVKGVQLEGLRVLGTPHEFAQRYYEAGIDEIIYVDIVASLYGRNNLREIVCKTANNVFIPITVAGGIRSVEDVQALLRCGADKVAINTAAVKRPALIKEVAERFGSQCMVLSIEAKSTGENSWEVYTDNGREKTGLNVLEWAQTGVALGAGEILLTAVDREGMRRGYDWRLVKIVSEMVSVPVIASGGMGSLEHLTEVIQQGKADAVAIADALHYKRFSLEQMRHTLVENGIQL